jgi:hypothetical protein
LIETHRAQVEDLFEVRPVTEMRTHDLSSRQTLQSAAVNIAGLAAPGSGDYQGFPGQDLHR